MTDRVKEALSAIMDGEAGDLETRRLLDEIARDDALRDTWDRFHLARGVIAGDPVTAMDSAEAIRSLWGAMDSGAGEESAEVVEPLTRTRRRPFGLRTGAAVLGVAAAAVQAALLYPVQESGGGLSSADSVAQAGSPETLAAEYATQDGLSPETPSRRVCGPGRAFAGRSRARPSLPIATFAATFDGQPRAPDSDRQAGDLSAAIPTRPQ